MSTSLFQVVVQSTTGNVAKNVLASDSTGKTALQSAIDAAINAAGTGATLQNAVEMAGKPLDFAVTPAQSPATNLSPKLVYSIQFRPGSGANNMNVAPVLVLSNAQ